MTSQNLTKIALLNQVIFNSMLEKDKMTIIKNFTKAGMQILDADFAIAWSRSNQDKEYKLAYKSPNFPYNPPAPRERAGNYIARKTKKPFFDSEVKAENYEFEIRKYLKSYIIIPIFHKNNMYGSLVFCYKNKHIFTEDEITLANILGNTAAQAMNTHRLFSTDLLLAEERRRTEFIANATHELRTPLAIMKGYIELALMNKKVSKSISPTLKIVNNEIDLLSKILKDLELLTVSGSEAKAIVHLQPIDIHKLLKTLGMRLRPLLSKKNITFTLSPNKPLPFTIPGDPVYIEKLFLNLIKNAITYGKEGGKIAVTISKAGQKIKIQVADNGIGISKEDISRIFERFYRADKSHNSVRSGLGLAIVKWVTKIHRGEIKVKSKVGEGTVFTVSLPIETKSN